MNRRAYLILVAPNGGDWEEWVNTRVAPDLSRTPDSLAADIATTNNGYLFVPTGADIACALANPDRFVIGGGGFPPNDVKVYTVETYRRNFPRIPKG